MSLSQSDFRTLIAAGQVGGSRGSHGAKKGETKKAPGRPAPKDGKKSTARLESFQKFQAKKEARAEKQKEDTQYRDRAKERRLDTNEDYQDPEQYAHVDAEQSKFLGGDIEHTHLVKGLDLALLQKVKAEIEQNEEEKLELQFAKSQNKKSSASGSLEPNEKKLKFGTKLGKAIFNVIMTKPSTAKSLETFVGGRMTYEFDLESNFGARELPTSVIQSLEEMDMKETVSGSIPPSALRRIQRIFGPNLEKAVPKGKRKKVKSKTSVTSDPLPTMPDEDNDDIFAGVGTDYQCEVDSSASERPNLMSSFNPDGKYFEEEEVAEDKIKQPETEPSIPKLDSGADILERTQKLEEIEEMHLKTESLESPAASRPKKAAGPVELGDAGYEEGVLEGGMAMGRLQPLQSMDLYGEAGYNSDEEAMSSRVEEPEVDAKGKGKGKKRKKMSSKQEAGMLDLQLQQIQRINDEKRPKGGRREQARNAKRSKILLRQQ